MNPNPGYGLPRGDLEFSVVVKQSNFRQIFANPISSDTEYFIDGFIDIGDLSIEVPAGGINIQGYNYNLSKISTSEDNHTIFTSPVGGSGNVIIKSLTLTASGTSSKVYDLTADSGFEAIEIGGVNFDDCTSLGQIDNYRQGLEFDTGRFGGSPSLEFVGVWVGGYRVSTSIVRSLSASMTEPLFKAGPGFTMASRFLNDMNCDLPANAALIDFSPGNFSNPSVLQFTGALISRNGVFDSSDSNLTPNISAADLASFWSLNQGLTNTFIGGVATVSVEVVTPIASSATFYTLLGTFLSTDLQHFDSPANGQLRHLGTDPLDFNFVADLSIDGGANDDIGIRIKKWDASASVFETVYDQRRQVNNFSGSRDVAFFNINSSFELHQNDYVFLEVANFSDTTNVTAELDSFYKVSAR